MAVAVVAALDAARGGPGPDRRAEPRARPPEPDLPGEQLTGPDVPAAGALTGTLHLAGGQDCGLRSLDLASVVLSEPGEPTGCRFWFSPLGDRVVLAAPLDARRATRELRLAPADRPAAGIVLGAALGEVSWSADGERLAWCGADGAVAVRVDGSVEAEWLVGCSPRFSPAGEIVTRSDGPWVALLAGDRVLLSREQLDAPLAELGGELLDVAGFGIGPDGTVAVAALGRGRGGEPLTVLELWRDNALRAAVPLPAAGSPDELRRFGLRVELSPDGNEAAVIFPEALAYQDASALVALVDLRTLAVVLAEPVVGDIAWSPDSAWLALALRDEVVVYGTDRSRPVYRLPVASRSLAWRNGR